MAFGDGVLEILDVLPPATSSATPDVRVGGSTPAEAVWVWDFDDSSVEYLDFKVRLSEAYTDRGLMVFVYWSAASATSGNCVWEVGLRRMSEDLDDIDAPFTYDFVLLSDTAPSVSGEVRESWFSIPPGTEMDNLAAGEMAILRIRRNASSTSDTMSGDAELWGIASKDGAAIL